MSQEQIIRIILLGYSDVGKTTILRHGFDKGSPGMLSTIGIDFRSKYFNFDNSKIKVNYIDTAAQEKFRSISLNFLRGKDGAMFVYDVSKRETYELIWQWLDDIKENNEMNIGKILVGNKVDLESKREVSKEEGEQLAEALQCKYYEISAKTGLNINEVIDEIARISYLKWKKDPEKRNSIRISSIDFNGKEKKNCCK